MAKEGFTARAKIEEVEFVSGKDDSTPYSRATVRMHGRILECDDLGYPGSFEPQKNSAQVRIDVTDNVDELLSIDDREVASRSIGKLAVYAERSNDNTVAEIEAHLQLLLPWSTLTYLLSLRSTEILVDLTFYKEKESDSRKFVFTSDTGAIYSYIKSVHFSTIPQNG